MRLTAPATEHTEPLPEELLRYVYATKQTIGQPFQGPSGRWYVRRSSDGHVVPSPTPGGGTNASVMTPSGKVARVPAAPPMAGRPVPVSGKPGAGKPGTPGAPSLAPYQVGGAPGATATPTQGAPLTADLAIRGIGTFIATGKAATEGQYLWTANHLSKMDSKELHSVALKLLARQDKGLAPDQQSRTDAVLGTIKGILEKRRPVKPQPAQPPPQPRTAGKPSIHAVVANVATDSLATATNLSEKDRATYGQAVLSVLGAMPATALEHMMKGLSKDGFNWYQTSSQMDDEFHKTGAKGKAQAFYDPGNLSLHMDSASAVGLPLIDKIFNKIFTGKTMEDAGLAQDYFASEASQSLVDIYSHEMSHALDRGLALSLGQGEDQLWYSDSNEWQHLWKTEIKGIFQSMPTVTRSRVLPSSADTCIPYPEMMRRRKRRKPSFRKLWPPGANMGCGGRYGLRHGEYLR